MATKKTFVSTMIIVNDVKKDEQGQPIINESSNGSFYYTLVNNKAEKFIREQGRRVINKNKTVNCYFDSMQEAESELNLDLKDIESYGQLEIEKISVVEEETEDEI